MKGILLLLFVASLNLGELMAADQPASWIQPWREATVALGQKQDALVTNPDGTKKTVPVFVVVGTGVMLALPGEESGVPWLVTAKHVFDDPEKNWHPESLQLRFSWFEGKAVDEYLGITIPLRRDGKPLWHAHPNATVDLATIPLAISVQEAGRNNVAPVTLADFASDEELFEGAGVLVLGYPGAVGASFWTRALLRSGIVAWVHPGSPSANLLLVDAAIFPGNSGGPVFRQPSGMDRNGSFRIGGRPSFVGIVSQGRQQAVPVLANGKEIEFRDSSGAAKLVGANWIGLGVIEPAGRVGELLTAAKNARVGSASPK